MVGSVGEVDSLGSSSSSDVQTELQRAVQLAIDQQKQLEDLRNIVEQQNKHISRLYRRDVNLGLELRPSSIQQKNSPCDVSTQAATTGNVLFTFHMFSVCLSVVGRSVNVNQLLFYDM